VRSAINYIASVVEDGTEEKLRQAIRTVWPEEGDELVDTIAEQWIEQGRQRGLEQGIQQGKREGVREGLLTGIKLALKLRFGSEGLRLLPEIYKIEDVDVLRAIHEGLEMVNTLDELTLIYRPGGDDGD